ncbi:MAG: GtrA family protein [Armatimonadota bacterium]
MRSVEELPAPLQRALMKPELRQFVKFCIVGASSTLISLSIFSFLLYVVGLEQVLRRWLADSPALVYLIDAFDAHVQVAALVAFLVAVTNGFLLNSFWTFRMKGAGGARERYVKFVLVNVIGLVLNQGILFLANRLLTPLTKGHQFTPLLAFVIAAVMVVFWNFNANRLWTFKTSDG